MRKLLYCTTNPVKFGLGAAVCSTFDIELVQQSVEVDEIQSEDPKKVIAHKVKAIYKLVKQPLLVSDDSWYIPALRGFPGPHMKSVNSWFNSEDWLTLVARYEDKRIFLNSHLAYIEDGKITYFDDHQERVFTPDFETEGSEPTILKTISLPGDSRPVSNVWRTDPDKLLTGRTLWEEFCTWYNSR